MKIKTSLNVSKEIVEAARIMLMNNESLSELYNLDTIKVSHDLSYHDKNHSEDYMVMAQYLPEHCWDETYTWTAWHCCFHDGNMTIGNGQYRLSELGATEFLLGGVAFWNDWRSPSEDQKDELLKLLKIFKNELEESLTPRDFYRFLNEKCYLGDDEKNWICEYINVRQKDVVDWEEFQSEEDY